MEQEWTTVIRAKNKVLNLNLKEVMQYRDLIILFVKRDFKTFYKQTILGPLWIILNPLCTTIIYTFIFGTIADLSTDGVPQFLFYLMGTAVWNFFSTCLVKTAGTFTGNAAIFGKVYFPRLVVPVSVVLSNGFNFLIQFILFLLVMTGYILTGSSIYPNIMVVLTPVLVFELGMLGMGTGIIISALTTKYRDLSILVNFGVQIWMYMSPVVYPASQVSGLLGKVIMLNPVSPILETFRCVYFGIGDIPYFYLLISAIVTACVFFIGVIIFNKVEKTFMDTI